MDEENLVIHRIFSNAVSKFPDKAALQLKKNTHWQKFTYKELEALSLKIAAFLIKEGFRKNDFAALVLENRPEWAIIYLGIMYAGLACVPLDPQLSSEEIKNFVFDSGAKVIFCSFDIFTQKINQDIKGRLDKIILLDAQCAEDKNIINFSALENIRPDTALLPAVLPEDIASLVYTSGTTAQSKGVLLTHKNICSNFRSIEKINIVFPSDNFLSILPLYHTYAFMATLILPLLLGARVTYFPVTFKPRDISAIIKEGGVTTLVGVPQLFSLLHKAISDKIKKIPFFFLFIILPFIKSALRRRMGKSLRLLVSGGARLEPKLGRQLSGLLGVKLIEGYGLTETSPIATINPPRKIKFGSAGKPIPGVQIKIGRADKSGVGEVLIKGANVMSGYFKHPEWTAQAIQEGWFYSGDLGYIDKEGYLFLTGREKDVIVLSSGKNIYPQELEEYYNRSPYIKELCVLSRSEERFGRQIESLYAVVVPDLDYFHQRNERDIQGKVRWELENLGKELPSYKHIMGFMISKEELPRTALKKIKRYQVKKKFLEGKSWEVEAGEAIVAQEDADILNRDIAKKIIAYISSEVKKPVYLNSHLELDLGIDSLSRVELGLGLEALFSVKIPEDVLYSVSTVKEVIARISEITAGALPDKETGKVAEKSWPYILSEQPPDKTLEKISIEPRFLDKLFTWISQNLILFIFRIFWSLRIEGRKHLPSEGPYLLCPNHASYLDGFVVFISLPLGCAMNTFFLGYSDILEHPLIKWTIKLARLIPIDPNANLTEAMQAVSFVLRHKKIACIFPEGRRSVNEDIGEFKKGVGILIKELNIPVVPVYIKGSHKSWPRTSRLPRFSALKIIFGKPLYWKELIREGAQAGPSDDYASIARGLREEVVKLTRF